MKRAHRAARRMRAHFATYHASLAYALRCVYRSAHALDYLVRHEGRPLLARFVKADGTVRRMRLRYDGAPIRRGTVPVFDLERPAPWGGYERRSLNLDTLAEITPAPPAAAPALRLAA